MVRERDSRGSDGADFMYRRSAMILRLQRLIDSYLLQSMQRRG